MLLLTVHQVDRAHDGEHEQKAHRHNQNGELTSLPADRVRLGLDVGASEAIHDREVCRGGDRNLIEVFGFLLMLRRVCCISFVDVEHEVVLSELGGAELERARVLQLREVLQIRDTQQEGRCALDWKQKIGLRVASN